MLNPNDIKLNDLSEKDIERLLEIQIECKLSIWSREDYQRELGRTDSHILVIRLNNKVIGFVAARLIISELKFSGKKYSEAEVLNFGVIKEFQDRGIGKILFKEFLQEVQLLGVKTIWLEVRAGNSKAIKFYENSGFVEIQKRKNFYAQPLEDTILMKLDGIDLSDIDFCKT